MIEIAHVQMVRKPIADVPDFIEVITHKSVVDIQYESNISLGRKIGQHSSIFEYVSLLVPAHVPKSCHYGECEIVFYKSCRNDCSCPVISCVHFLENRKEVVAGLISRGFGGCFLSIHVASLEIVARPTL